MKEMTIGRLIKSIIYGTFLFFGLTIIAFILLNAGAMIFQHQTIVDLFIIWNNARLQIDSGLLSTNTISLIYSIVFGVGWGFQVWMCLPKEDML